MRNKGFIFICTVAFAIMLPVVGNAADSRVATQEITLQVAGSALLAISGPPVVLQMAGAAEAGDSISQRVENSDTRLRISSMVSGEERRSISAKISEDLVGTRLYVALLSPNENFANRGQMGELKGEQLVTSVNEITLIEGIGNCWSGKQDGDGYVIKYSYRPEEGASILKGGNITITYTISLVPSDNE